MTKSNTVSLSWDDRYSSETYVYGKEPNVFFSALLNGEKPGSILLPGEGEGRNAVHAARLGWQVDAFDQSRIGQGKAMALASEFGVGINYTVCALEDFDFPRDRYDLVALLFFHAGSSIRQYLHRKVVDALKPGGRLILEAFHKDQINNNTGGPKSLEMLFDEETLENDFTSLETDLLEHHEIILDEGPFHQGLAHIIRYTGIKPK